MILLQIYKKEEVKIKLAKLTFTIKRVKKRYDTFAEIIGTGLKCDNKIWQKELRKEMEIRGTFPLSLDIGDKFEADVIKLIDKRSYTPYFELTEKNLPKRIGLESENELAKFLRTKINNATKENEKLKKWKLTLSTSKKIIQYLGIDAINKIIDNPIQLLLYDDLKLNDDKVFEMQRILKDNSNLQKIIITLKTSKIPMKTILSLYDSYGERTLNILLTNPYQICYDNKISFKLADKIAFDKKINKFNETRIKTAIIDYLRYKKKCGNICIYKEQFFNCLSYGQETIFDYLNRTSAYKDNNIPINLLNEQIDILISENRIIKEIIDNRECIYLPEMHLIEEKLVYKVLDILSNTYNQNFCTRKEAIDFLDYYENTYNIKLDHLQKVAVINALQSKISILTGGPGTGKTATVGVIVSAIKYISKNIHHKEPNFILAAPTGKAAERMTELTNESASTIHRLLGLGFNQYSDYIIDADYVIVDEGSMIDINLMYHLLNSLSENTRILIVGDFNQLPSVDPGKVLNDFIDSEEIPKVQLTTIFRQAQGSAIVESANKIIKGYNSQHPKGIILTNDDNRNFKFIRDLSIEGIKLNLINKIDEYLSKGISIKNVQILTPLRRGELGVEVLNSIMQEKYNPNPVLFEDEKNGLKFKVGDKVIQTVNNYDLNVFNGYIGEIIEIDENNVVNGIITPIIIVEYENCDNPITYEGSDIFELELAYVLTVHKSQGSEYPYVIMPINTEQNIMLNRNLLYTAVTRARKECIIIGDEKAVNKAIDTELSIYERISNIKIKIQKRCGMMS